MASHLAVDFRRRAGIADSAARRTGIALERAAWSNAMLLLPSPLSSPSYASRCLDQGRTRRVIASSFGTWRWLFMVVSMAIDV
jgi:hypothetical protein